eukprot:352484-Chlamydomonas_euryale.AAC.2
MAYLGRRDASSPAVAGAFGPCNIDASGGGSHATAAEAAAAAEAESEHWQPAAAAARPPPVSAECRQPFALDCWPTVASSACSLPPEARLLLVALRDDGAAGVAADWAAGRGSRDAEPRAVAAATAAEVAPVSDGASCCGAPTAEHLVARWDQHQLDGGSGAAAGGGTHGDAEQAEAEAAAFQLLPKCSVDAFAWEVAGTVHRLLADARAIAERHARLEQQQQQQQLQQQQRQQQQHVSAHRPGTRQATFACKCARDMRNECRKASLLESPQSASTHLS